MQNVNLFCLYLFDHEIIGREQKTEEDMMDLRAPLLLIFIFCAGKEYN